MKSANLGTMVLSLQKNPLPRIDTPTVSIATKKSLQEIAEPPKATVDPPVAATNGTTGKHPPEVQKRTARSAGKGPKVLKKIAQLDAEKRAARAKEYEEDDEEEEEADGDEEDGAEADEDGENEEDGEGAEAADIEQPAGETAAVPGTPTHDGEPPPSRPIEGGKGPKTKRPKAKPKIYLGYDKTLLLEGKIASSALKPAHIGIAYFRAQRCVYYYVQGKMAVSTNAKFKRIPNRKYPEDKVFVEQVLPACKQELMKNLEIGLKLGEHKIPVPPDIAEAMAQCVAAYDPATYREQLSRKPKSKPKGAKADKEEVRPKKAGKKPLTTAEEKEKTEETSAKTRKRKTPPTEETGGETADVEEVEPPKPKKQKARPVTAEGSDDEAADNIAELIRNKIKTQANIRLALVKQYTKTGKVDASLKELLGLVGCE